MGEKINGEVTGNPFENVQGSAVDGVLLAKVVPDGKQPIKNSEIQGGNFEKNEAIGNRGAETLAGAFSGTSVRVKVTDKSLLPLQEKLEKAKSELTKNEEALENAKKEIESKEEEISNMEKHTIAEVAFIHNCVKEFSGAMSKLSSEIESHENRIKDLSAKLDGSGNEPQSEGVKRELESAKVLLGKTRALFDRVKALRSNGTNKISEKNKEFKKEMRKSGEGLVKLKNKRNDAEKEVEKDQSEVNKLKTKIENAEKELSSANSNKKK
jgi:chromosome segregation ATPase